VFPYDKTKRNEGTDWPIYGLTMVRTSVLKLCHPLTEQSALAMSGGRHLRMQVSMSVASALTYTAGCARHQ
jgi:hypothetical protein